MNRLFLFFCRRLLESNGWQLDREGWWKKPTGKSSSICTWEADAVRRMIEGFCNNSKQ